MGTQHWTRLHLLWSKADVNCCPKTSAVGESGSGGTISLAWPGTMRVMTALATPARSSFERAAASCFFYGRERGRSIWMVIDKILFCANIKYVIYENVHVKYTPISCSAPLYLFRQLQSPWFNHYWSCIWDINHRVIDTGYNQIYWNIISLKFVKIMVFKL